MSHYDAAMKREAVLAALRRWGGGWTTKQIVSRFKEEEVERHGHPIGLTGGVYIPPWEMYSALVKLRVEGKVRRKKLSARTIQWTAVAP